MRPSVGLESRKDGQSPGLMEEVRDEAARNGVSGSELRTVLAGLMLVIALGSLDQNIVATALPRIVGELGGLSHISWIVTAYVLTSTTAMPLYGKLSDQYGRRLVLYSAIAIFLAGSVLSGLSRSMMELIVFRAIQGLGAGGLVPLAQTVLGDLIAPRERGRYQALFGTVFAVCSVAGPVLGGLITDWLSWHWIFYVNLPVGLAASALIGRGLRQPHRLTRRRIDYLGAALLAAGTSCLLLALSVGGSFYRWTSPEIGGLAAAGAATLLLFFFHELRAEEPVLPLHLFGNRVVVIAWAVLALTFMAYLGGAIFFPLFFQLVLGMTPSFSGLLISPLTAGLVIATTIGGRRVAATGRYKPYAVGGLALASAGYLVLGWSARSSHELMVIEAALVVIGSGAGLVLPNAMLAVQNSITQLDLGVATATSIFFRAMGGVIGVATSGAILTMQLQSQLGRAGIGRSTLGGNLADQAIVQMAQLPPATRDIALAAYAHAISLTFFAAGAATVLAFCLVLLLPELPLRSGRTRSGSS